MATNMPDAGDNRASAQRPSATQAKATGAAGRRRPASFEVYSRYRRPTEDDEPEDIDSDGEVYERFGVFVSYEIKKAGLTIKLAHRLPDE